MTMVIWEVMLDGSTNYAWWPPLGYEIINPRDDTKIAELRYNGESHLRGTIVQLRVMREADFSFSLSGSPNFRAIIRKYGDSIGYIDENGYHTWIEEEGLLLEPDFTLDELDLGQTIINEIQGKADNR